MKNLKHPIVAITIGSVLLLSAPAAHAVNNTWFQGTVQPNTSRYESGTSTGFLRNSSNATSGLNGNPWVRMTCYLGSHYSVGGDACSVSTSTLNNERAGFKYENQVQSQAAPLTAWIGGIPGGGMKAAENSDEDATLEAESNFVERWSDSEWRLETSQSGDSDFSVRLLKGDYAYTTTGSIESYNSAGISLSAGDGVSDISVTVFPDNSTVDISQNELQSGQAVANGVFIHTE